MQTLSLIDCYTALTFATRDQLTELARQLVERSIEAGQQLMAEELDPTASYSSIETQLRTNTDYTARVVRSDLEDVANVMADILTKLEVEVESVTLNQCGFVSAECKVVDKT